MPIFEYHCNACEKDFEILVLGKEKVSCPECKGKKVTRLLSKVSHKSDHGFTSSEGSSCTSCKATSCSGCGH